MLVSNFIGAVIIHSHLQQSVVLLLYSYDACTGGERRNVCSRVQKYTLTIVLIKLGACIWLKNIVWLSLNRYPSSCKLLVLQTQRSGSPWWRLLPNPAGRSQTSRGLWICPRRSSSYLHPHQRTRRWLGPDSGRNSGRWCPGTPGGCSQTSASGSDEHKSEMVEHSRALGSGALQNWGFLRLSGQDVHFNSPQSSLQVPDSEQSPPSTDSPCSPHLHSLSTTQTHEHY